MLLRQVIYIPGVDPFRSWSHEKQPRFITCMRIGLFFISVKTFFSAFEKFHKSQNKF